MEQLKSYAPVAWAILIGILLQGILTIVDCKESPHRASVEFVQAYFRADPAMAGRLCKKLTSGDNVNLVEDTSGASPETLAIADLIQVI